MKKLSQYFNSDGLVQFVQTVLYRRHNFVPNESLRSVSDIDYLKLKRQGLNYIVFDKDNTLTAPYVKTYFSREVESSILDSCFSAFGPAFCACISNSAGSLKYDPDHEEATQCEKALLMPFIRHERKKPNVMPDILRHFEITDASQVCIVGDRLLTDVVMGNEAGCYTILVEPLDPSKDNKMVQIVRRFESLLIPKS